VPVALAGPNANYLHFTSDRYHFSTSSLSFHILDTLPDISVKAPKAVHQNRSLFLIIKVCPTLRTLGPPTGYASLRIRGYTIMRYTNSYYITLQWKETTTNTISILTDTLQVKMVLLVPCLLEVTPNCCMCPCLPVSVW